MGDDGDPLVLQLADDAMVDAEVAVRAAAMSPLDENHQALSIRLHRLAGEDDAAEKRRAAFSEVLERELGTAPGPAVEAAAREARHEREAVADAYLGSVESDRANYARAVATSTPRSGSSSLDQPGGTRPLAVISSPPQGAAG